MNGRGNGWWTTLALGAAALLLFLALPQRTLHGVDGDVFVSWVEQGRRDYPRHVAYLHFAGLVHDLGLPFGMSAFAALLISSALGSALSVMFLHRAFRLLAPAGGRGAALLAAAAAVTPACFFYATCAEIHGVFAAGAGAAWWAFARWWQRPSVSRATVVGAVTGAAATLHAFGHLLAPTFVAVAVCTLRPARRGILWALPAAAAAHAGVAAIAAWLLGAGATGQVQDALRFTSEQLARFAPATAPDVLVREWLWPCAPWSILALSALAAPGARRWAVATAAGLLLHLPFTVLLLGHHQIREGGAYHLALVPAAVLATARLLRPVGFCVAAGLALALSLWTAAPHWPPPASAEFTAAVGALNDERPMALIVGRRHELEGARTSVRDLVVFDLGAALDLWLSERERGVSLGRWFDGWLRRFDRMGMPLLLSASAHAWFRDTPDPEVRAFWDGDVPRRYVVVPEVRHGFTGVWVLPQSEDPVGR